MLKCELKVARAMALAGCGIFISSGLAAAASAHRESPTVEARASISDISIISPALGSTIRLTTSARFGGAVTSIVFRGTQYVDALDHGRELQSAASFDGYGECFNPTEAGSRDDGSGPSTSSKVLAANAGRNWLATKTNMAFWLAPGTKYEKQCGIKKGIDYAINTNINGDYVLDKRIELGLNDRKNVIVDHVTFHVPDAHRDGTFEAATIYTPSAFYKHYVIDLNSGNLSQTTMFGEQSKPVILATSDGKSAVGVFSSELPQSGHRLGYGIFGFSNTNKINCVFRENSIRAGQNFSYRCYFAIGTLDEVRATIMALNRHS